VQRSSAPPLRFAVIVFVVWTVLAIRGRQSIEYAQTRAQIAELREALRRYYADTGSYPTTDQGLLALVSGSDPLDPGMVRPPPAPAGAPTDACGDPFVYKSDGTSYVVKSLGSGEMIGEKDSGLEAHSL